MGIPKVKHLVAVVSAFALCAACFAHPLVDGFSIRGALVGGSETGPDFWELEFVRGEETVKINNRAPAVKTRGERAGVAAFLWKGIDLPGEKGVLDVRAHVKDLGNSRHEWTLKIANRSRTWALFKTRYPYLRDVAGNGPADFIYPINHLGAQLVKNFRRGNRSRDYPGTMVMMTAFFQGDQGFYFAAHDGEGRIKKICWSEDGGAWFETVVENAGVLGKAADGPGYGVVTASFKGDWWDAAKIYREWALKQKWCAKGPMVSRADYPRAMSDVATWWRISKSLRPEVAADLVKATWGDVKTGFRFYHWNNEPFDTFYPDFSPKKETPGVIAHAKELGVTVLPYVNGKIWDMNLPSYEGAKPLMLKNRDGSEVSETYGRVKFGVVCPFVRQWHEKLAGMRKLVIDEVGSNGIYYDQIAISAATPCWDPAHGHPVGGGRWWADGQHDSLKPIHDSCSAKGFPVTSEGFNETLIDVVDGMLICGRQEEQSDIPLLPAIYSGYTTFFNSEENATDDPKAFFALQARAVLRGIAIGTWEDAGLFDGTMKAQSDIIHTLARVRTAAAEFLAYGQLEDELRFASPVGQVKYVFSPTRPHRRPNPVAIEFPAVVGTAWKTVDGRKYAIFAANVSSQRQDFRFHLPSALAKGAMLKALPDQPGIEFSAEGPVGKLSLPPQAIAWVVSSSDSSTSTKRE